MKLYVVREGDAPATAFKIVGIYSLKERAYEIALSLYLGNLRQGYIQEIELDYTPKEYENLKSIKPLTCTANKYKRNNIEGEE